MVFYLGTVVVTVQATDEDGVNEEGGRVSYSILSGDSTQRFYVDPDTGEVSVNAALDYDTLQFYILQVCHQIS